MRRRTLCILLCALAAAGGAAVVLAVRRDPAEHPTDLWPSEVGAIKVSSNDGWGDATTKEQVEHIINNLRETELGASTPCSKERIPEEGLIRIIIAKKEFLEYETLYVSYDGRLFYFDGEEPYSGTIYETRGTPVDIAYLESVMIH